MRDGSVPTQTQKGTPQLGWPAFQSTAVSKPRRPESPGHEPSWEWHVLVEFGFALVTAPETWPGRPILGSFRLQLTRWRSMPRISSAPLEYGPAMTPARPQSPPAQCGRILALPALCRRGRRSRSKTTEHPLAGRFQEGPALAPESGKKSRARASGPARREGVAAGAVSAVICAT